MIGRLVDGRYQVRSRIARGGMATVYLATDLRLERRVAIKVMHGHLADDSQYKARFIQEARSAARLAHPNVVNVYDQGQDSDTAYLVMEYLPGITLRDLLQEHRILTTDQAFDIMEAVLAGLAAAHHNGIVHRDLKPENVLLADDGRIKIGDFGLARAATANTATGNALLGTIAYLSPELVTRGIADTRSDIYAVGIMLFEMLAGEQPFKGEQPFQIAHQHANDTVGTPSTFNRNVPTELDELVLWATARDPDQRPRDAQVMLDQLLETQADLRAGRTATMVQRTVVMPSPAPDVSNDATQVLRPPAAAVAAPPRRQRTGPVVADSAAALETRSRRRRRTGWWLFALVLLLAALAGGAGWYFNAGPGALVAIPDSVTGDDEATARGELTDLGLEVASATTTATHPTIDPGLVVGTDPASGTSVQRGSPVTLVLSAGPAQFAVPTLIGQPEDAALQAITDSGFATTDSAPQFDSEVPAGNVIDALAEDGSSLNGVAAYSEQRPIALIVSLGPVPDVIGLPLADARQALDDANLIGQEGAHAYSDDVAEGSVTGQTLVGDGPVRPGATFDLAVSDGPAPVIIPDVVGDTWASAKQALSQLGLRLSYNQTADNFADEVTVRAIEPGVGESVDQGSTVTVRFNPLPL